MQCPKRYRVKDQKTFKILLESNRIPAPRLGAVQVPMREESDDVKYLALLDFEHSSIEEVEKKAKAFWKAQEENPEKFPDFPVGGHFMTKGKSGFAIWETDDPAKIAYKIGFMLPEVKYTLIPGIPGREFFKAYFESKK